MGASGFNWGRGMLTLIHKLSFSLVQTLPGLQGNFFPRTLSTLSGTALPPVDGVLGRTQQCSGMTPGSAPRYHSPWPGGTLWDAGVCQRNTVSSALFPQTSICFQGHVSRSQGLSGGYLASGGAQAQFDPQHRVLFTSQGCFPTDNLTLITAGAI